MKKTTSNEYQPIYSWTALIAKPDMLVSEININIPIREGGTLDRKAVIKAGISNARAKKNPKNTLSSTYVRVNDIGSDVLVGKSGIDHGLSRISTTQSLVVMIVAGDVLSNSIAINELNSRTTKKGTTEMSYVLLGVARGNSDLYAVRFIVDKLSNEVADYEILQLKAIRAKEKSLITDKSATEGHSLSALNTISICDLLEEVKSLDLFTSVFTSDVLANLGVSRSNRDHISQNLRFSEISQEQLDVAKKHGFSAEAAARLLAQARANTLKQQPSRNHQQTT